MHDHEQAVSLSLDTLASLPPAVGRPAYPRAALSPGILHFGPGNFHRAHQGVYLDRLMSAGKDHDWAIVGASVMPGDAALRERLLAQDCLGSVVAQSASDSEACVTGAMIDYLPAADGEAILAALTDPAIRIVSLTVTEGGYYVDAETGQFDHQHAAIAADASHFDKPVTVFGLITRALMLRRDAGQSAFTVMSCDNLPHNGVVTRQAVVGMARLVDPELADWIEAQVSFPNGMVDRIAPATGERERRLVIEDHGIADPVPVFCEDYMQWVLEDKFVAGRPALETVGVEFVDDVAPYETMKIRILNGGHALLAYPAGLMDIEFANQAMQHPLVKGFIDKVEREEIIPIVPPVPNTNLSEYFSRVSERFANPNIGDTVRRLCLDGSNRQPKFILTSIRDCLDQNRPIDGLALACALWCRYCYGETDSGAVIEPNDPSWTRLQEMAVAAREEPALWLGMREVYGDLADDPRLQEPFAAALNALWQDGTEAVLTRFLAD